MDSQHRHDLQENWLAHRLELFIEAAKPHLPMIIFGVVAVVVAIGGINWLRSSSESSSNLSWDSYAFAMGGATPSLPLLKRVSEDYAGAPAAEWADITLADGRLFVATQSYFANRDSANSALEEAKETFEQLRGASAATIRNRAVFGLARVAELEGDLAAAQELYGQVTGAFKTIAEQRLEDLNKQRVSADYAWLATAKPQPTRSSAGSGLPGLLPDFSVDQIETPSAGGTAVPVPSGKESIDDILNSIDAEQQAAAEAAAAAADLQPAGEEQPAAEGTTAEGSGAEGSGAEGSDAEGSDAEGSDAEGSDAEGSDAEGSGAEE